MYRFDANSDGGQNKETQAEIVEIEDVEMGLITIYGCNFFVPLHPQIDYDPFDLNEPEFRYFSVHQK